jgi:hypothetical protein
MKRLRLSPTIVYLMITIIGAIFLFFVVSVWALAIILEGGTVTPSSSETSVIRSAAETVFACVTGGEGCSINQGRDAWSTIADLLSLVLGIPAALLGSLVAIFLAQRAVSLTEAQLKQEDRAVLLAEAQLKQETTGRIQSAADMASSSIWRVARSLRALFLASDVLKSETAAIVRKHHEECSKEQTPDQGFGVKELVESLMRGGNARDFEKVFNAYKEQIAALTALRGAIDELVRSPVALRIIEDEIKTFSSSPHAAMLKRIMKFSKPDSPLKRTLRTLQVQMRGQAIGATEFIGDLSALLESAEVEMVQKMHKGGRFVCQDVYRATHLTDLGLDMRKEVLCPEKATKPEDWIADQSKVDLKLVGDIAQRYLENPYKPAHSGSAGSLDWSIVSCGAILWRERSLSKIDDVEEGKRSRALEINMGLVCLSMCRFLVPESSKQIETSFVSSVQDVLDLPSEMTPNIRQYIRLMNIQGYISSRVRSAMDLPEEFAVLVPTVKMRSGAAHIS